MFYVKGEGTLRAAIPILLLLGAFFGFYAVYFSPALLQGFLLAPGDGEIYYYPAFRLSPWEIWNESILSGYPIAADIQLQTFYPLRWLSPTFNVLVLSAYVIMASGMFGLALRLTGSRWGALAAAMVASGSGFMVGHLGHPSLIHAAAWIPFMLWAIASVREAQSAWPIVLGAFAVALSLLGGHPQVSIIGLLLSGCFGLYEIIRPPGDGGFKFKVLASVTGIFVLGFMLAAPVLLPFVQAASSGVRPDWSLAAFNAFSHDIATLRLLAFPNLYGGTPPGPYGPYRGPWNLTELAAYVGILPWLLLIGALAAGRVVKGMWFWLGATGVALLLSMGAATPLGELLYRLPVFGQFRAQARFGVAMSLSMAILSAYGIAGLLSGRWDASRRWIALTVAACASLLVLGSTLFNLPEGTSMDSGMVWVPCAIFVVSISVLWVFIYRPSAGTAMIAILVLVVDLGTFGWFYEWRYGRPVEAEVLARPTADLIGEMSSEDGRVLPLGGAQMPTTPLRPNINMRYGIDSVVGYGPLVSGRYTTFTGADPTGGINTSDLSAPMLDVLGVRWIAGENAPPDSFLLGRGCGAPGNLTELRGRIPDGVTLRAVHITSNLSCSTGVGNGAAVAAIELRSAQGSITDRLTIDAGEETAEWAYDRPDVRASIAHSRPVVAETFPAGDYSGLWFDGTWPVSDISGAREVRVMAAPSAPVPIRVKALRVVDDQGRTIPIELAPVGDDARLSAPRSVPGLPPVRERLGYRGMAWAVCEVRGAKPDEIKLLLAGGHDASGRRFDPQVSALIEEGIALPAANCSSPPEVEVIQRRSGFWKLRTRGQGTALLVISESYNRDFVARVDGIQTKIVPVDGLVVGVPISPGEHTIEVRYRPKSFWGGVVTMLLALAVCLGLLIGRKRQFRTVRNKDLI